MDDLLLLEVDEPFDYLIEDPECLMLRQRPLLLDVLFKISLL